MTPGFTRLGKSAAGLLAAGLIAMAGALPAIAQVKAIQVNFLAPQHREIVGTTTIQVEARSSAQGVESKNMIKDLTIRVQRNGEPRNSGICQPGESPGLCRTRNYEGPPVGASQAQAREVLDLEWKTREVSPENGLYDVVSVARSDIPGVQDSDVKVLEDLQVNNPPLAPANLSVSAPQRGDPKLTVFWAPNPEVDLTGYLISKAVDDGAFSTPARLSRDSTSFQDAGLPFDKPIRYRLVALRKSPVSGEIASAPATTSEVSIQAPPPPPSPTPSGLPDGAGVKASTKSDSELKDLSGKLGTPNASGRAVKPISLPAPNSITGPRRDGGSGFGRLLPFGKDSPQSFIDEDFAESVGEAIRNPGRMISEEMQINPTRFIAAAVLLFVTAGHLGRGAQTLFQSAQQSASSTQRITTA